MICSNPAFTVLVYCFAKKDKANVSASQLDGFKSLAKLLRTYSIERAQAALVELEVSHGN